MAKNPAFPFYANDYLVDTLRWSRAMKGLHVDLLAESWSNGRIDDDGGFPAGLNEEDKKVWVSIRHKWLLKDGAWFNEKLEGLRADRARHLAKQAENGRLGGRPKPKHNPPLSKSITQTEPKQKPLEDEEEREKEEEGLRVEGVGEGKPETIDARLDAALVDTYTEPLMMNGRHLYPGVDINLELARFRQKVKGAPRVYAEHDTGGLRLAFEHQLRSAKPTLPNGKQKVSIKDFLADA